MSSERTQINQGGIISIPIPEADNATIHRQSGDETQSSQELLRGNQQCDKNENDNVQGFSSKDMAGVEAEEPSAPIDVRKDQIAAPELELEMEEDNVRQRLKRHRVEVAGRVWIPEIWGQEEFLKDWIDCSAFDASLVPNGIVLARAGLVREGRLSSTGRLRIENRC